MQINASASFIEHLVLTGHGAPAPLLPWARDRGCRLGCKGEFQVNQVTERSELRVWRNGAITITLMASVLLFLVFFVR